MLEVLLWALLTEVSVCLSVELDAGAQRWPNARQNLLTFRAFKCVCLCMSLAEVSKWAAVQAAHCNRDTSSVSFTGKYRFGEYHCHGVSACTDVQVCLVSFSVEHSYFHSLLFIKWCCLYLSAFVARNGALVSDWIPYLLDLVTSRLDVWCWRLPWCPCQNDWCSSRGSNCAPPRYKSAVCTAWANVLGRLEEIFHGEIYTKFDCTNCEC